MNIETFYWWFAFLGSLASLIGLPVVIWQIVKARRIAEATQRASLRTQRIISRNLLLSEASICVRHIQETKLFISEDSLRLSQIRLNDIIAQLIQIQEMLYSPNQNKQSDDLNAIFLELTKIRSKIGKKLVESSVKINKAQVNSKLDIISDSLNKIIGKIKIDFDQGG